MSFRAPPRTPPPSAEYDSGSDDGTYVVPHAAAVRSAPPPPLPPKPSYARGPDLPRPAPPPPLPPKPDSARAPRLPELPPRPVKTPSLSASPVGSDSARANANRARRQQDVSLPLPPFLPPPRRPLPPLPPGAVPGERRLNDSWTETVPVALDGLLAQTEFPQPPERSIFSECVPAAATEALNEGGPLANAAIGEISALDPPTFEVPMPPPPHSFCDCAVATLFPPPTAEFLSVRSTPAGVASTHFRLSPESLDDVHAGSISIERKRARGTRANPHARGAPVPWRPYVGEEPGAEVWTVLNEVVNVRSVSSPEWSIAAQLLVGFVISASLDSYEAGHGLLSEIVRRMRASTYTALRAAVFTVLINVFGQISFTSADGGATNSIEKVAADVLSEVLVVMDGVEQDPSVWEKATRCMLLFVNGNDWMLHCAISTEALIALTLHLDPLLHPDVDHILIADGLCHRFGQGKNAKPRHDVDEVSMYAATGGARVLLDLYVHTASLSARRRLFRLIVEVAVSRAFSLDEGLQKAGDVEKQTEWLVVLLESHDVGNAMVLTFRFGSRPNFVMDTIRRLLFAPLMSTASSKGDGQSQNRSGLKVPVNTFGEKLASQDFSDSHENDSAAKARYVATTLYTRAVRAANHLLHKRFVLSVLCELEKMAEAHSRRYATIEEHRHAEEWAILQDAGRQLYAMRDAGHAISQRTVTQELQKLFTAVAGFVTLGASPESVIRLADLVLESFLVAPMFSSFASGMNENAVCNSAASLFLAGRRLVARDMVARANPAMFVNLLKLLEHSWQRRHVSEVRQCLIELIGVVPERASMLTDFSHDPDAAIVYRASLLYSAHFETSQKNL